MYKGMGALIWTFCVCVWGGGGSSHKREEQKTLSTYHIEPQFGQKLVYNTLFSSGPLFYRHPYYIQTHSFAWELLVLHMSVS